MANINDRQHSINKKFYDLGDGTYAEIISLPPGLMTDNNGAGDHPRLRVDPAQTSFFDGREFRTFLEFDIATTSYVAVKAVTAVDTVLFGLVIDLVDGAIDIETVIGGTEGGSYTAMPVIAVNSMSSAPSYTPVNTVSSGGTHTGGTTIDLLKLSVSSQGAQHTSVGAVGGDERGVPASTFYFRINSVGASNAQGVIRARWEERPSGT